MVLLIVCCQGHCFPQCTWTFIDYQADGKQVLSWGKCMAGILADKIL